VSFASVLIGFSEDFILLEDGRYLLSDAVLGSVWVAQLDGIVFQARISSIKGKLPSVKLVLGI
jgi:hypothetical protein